MIASSCIDMLPKTDSWNFELEEIFKLIKIGIRKKEVIIFVYACELLVDYYHEHQEIFDFNEKETDKK